MHNINAEFFEELKAGQCLVVMPISRLRFEEAFEVEGFKFYPAGSTDVLSLRPVPNKAMESFEGAYPITLEGQDLREVSTTLTGFSIKILQEKPVVAFTVDLDWDQFLSGDHQYDISLLKRLSAKAERAMDIVRFDFCRFDLPDTLPGMVGSWEGSSEYLGALLYNIHDHESYLVAGAAIVSTVVTKGLGLEIAVGPTTAFPDVSKGGISGITSHGLALFSDAMTANNDTVKFTRIMTLLEFLACPDEFENWQKLKSEIICHFAKDKQSYHKLAERFRELTSIKDAEQQKGYRTLIVHHGQFIENIIPDEKDRRRLFLELQKYAGKVLYDMLKNPYITWQEFSDYRKSLKMRLGIVV